MKAKFDCVFYYVSDIERSVRFYRDVLVCCPGNT
jgi:catechol 2,3-dioxygenase-like lactoylglutathione lyase family enzyme